jgi:PncC family amidohydrolase
MSELQPIAERVAVLLTQRGETIAIAESAAGGLMTAALLTVPGASRYFLGGAVLYTGAARQALLGITPEDMTGIRPATEAYALLVALRCRERMASTWALAETGVAGPAGNRYGDPAGHACFAVSGPGEAVLTIETASGDRALNMRAFAAGGLELLERVLAANHAPTLETQRSPLP